MSNLALHARMARLPSLGNPTNLVVTISVVLFLLVPFLQSFGLRSFVNSLLGRLSLIGFVLYGITLGPLPGVLAFLAVAAVFAERNRFQIGITQQSIISKGSVPTLGQVDMPHSTPAPVNKPLRDEPWLKYDTHASFLDGDSDTWNPLPSGESEDDKGVLESQLYPNDRQDRFYVATGLAPENPNA